MGLGKRLDIGFDSHKLRISFIGGAVNARYRPVLGFVSTP